MSSIAIGSVSYLIGSYAVIYWAMVVKRRPVEWLLLYLPLSTLMFMLLIAFKS